MSDEHLTEVKATGEDSETIDPVTPAGGSPKGKNRKADKDQGDKTADSVDKSKHPKGDAFDKTSPAEKPGTGKKSPPRRADKVKMGEAVEEIFDGQELSEDFMARATTLVETAVNEKVAEEVERLEEEFEDKLEEQTEQAVSEIVEKLDKYLDGIIKEWMEENEVALENGIKTEMAESFMNSLFDLYQEHRIVIPEESEDALDKLAEQIDELEGKLDKALVENMELSGKLEEAAKEDIFEEVSESLTDVEKEKLNRLAEGVDYSDMEDFKGKLEVIKEHYFDKKTKKTLTEDSSVDTSTVDVDENVVTGDPEVLKYAQAISKTVKK